MTLIEVLISFAIASILFGAVVNVFRNYMAQKDIHDAMVKFNHDIQLVEKQLYLDCLRLGPDLSMSESGDIFINGEATAQPIPQTIRLYDTDRDAANGAEMMRMKITFLEPFGSYQDIEYGFDKKNGTLYRKEGIRKKILVEGLSELHFHSMKKGLKITGKEKRTSKEQDFTTAFSFVTGFIKVVWSGYKEPSK